MALHRGTLKHAALLQPPVMATIHVTLARPATIASIVIPAVLAAYVLVLKTKNLSGLQLNHQLHPSVKR
jgi:hypothetical protein